MGICRTYIPTIIITSTPVIITPSPSTSLWSTSSCTTSTGRRSDRGFENLLVKANRTGGSSIQSPQRASEADFVPTTLRTTKLDVASNAAEKTNTQVEDIVKESGQAENSSSDIGGVSASKTSREPGQTSLYSVEAKVRALQLGTKASATLAYTFISTKQSPQTPRSLSTLAASDTNTAWEWSRGRNVREKSQSIDRLSITSSLPNERRQWWGHSSTEYDNESGGDDEDDVTSDDVSCNAITTSSITLFYAPITSWSTVYLTNSVASELIVPTQTIWTDCEPGSTEVWTTSVDLSHPTAQTDEEVSHQATSINAPKYGGSTTAEGDGAWIVTPSSSSISESWRTLQSSIVSDLSLPVFSSPITTSPAGHMPSSIITFPSLSVSTTANPSRTTSKAVIQTYITPAPVITTAASTTVPSNTASSTNTHAAAAAADNTTSSSTVSSTPSSTSSHHSKAVSAGAAIGGVFGLFALLALFLFIIRWWKRRQRIQRTNELRSSWFYGGDVPEPDMGIDDEKDRSEYPFSNAGPQSRFSAPSLLSRQSLAVSMPLGRPTSHMRQGSGRFMSILSFKRLRNSFFSRSEGSHKQQDNKAWADKYTYPPRFSLDGESRKRRISPPRAFMMDPCTNPTDDQVGWGDGGPYPRVIPSLSVTAHQAPSRIELREATPVTWGSSYATTPPLRPQSQSVSLGWQSVKSQPKLNVVAPSEASHSIYSDGSTYIATGLSRGNTMRSIQSQGESLHTGEGVVNAAASNFPMPPLTFPMSHALLPHDPYAPSHLPEIPFISFSPNFSHRNLHDSALTTRSTAQSSGTWEYAAYADPGDASPVPVFSKGLDDARVTRDWYEKPLWDGRSMADPMSACGVATISREVRGVGRDRKSMKSVRWKEEGLDNEPWAL